jgi:hypothetical protein
MRVKQKQEVVALLQQNGSNLKNMGVASGSGKNRQA